MSILILGVCTSCNRNIPTIDDEWIGFGLDTIISPSYVWSYHNTDSMYLSKYNTRKHGEELQDDYGVHVIFMQSGEHPIIAWREYEPIYDSICAKHNDTTYYQPLVSGTGVFKHNYWAFDLVSIQVTSNANFDAEHPAGTLLNDIVQFTAYTPYPYIQAGYKDCDEITLINKPLIECTPADFILTLGNKENDNLEYAGHAWSSCYLIVNAIPTLSQQHTITVTILDDAGKTWEASIDMDWRQNYDY